MGTKTLASETTPGVRTTGPFFGNRDQDHFFGSSGNNEVLFFQAKSTQASSGGLLAGGNFYTSIPDIQRKPDENVDTELTDPYSIPQIVTDVYQAIKGAGTTETLLIDALSRLEQDDAKIQEFQQLFEKTYGYEPIEWIRSEVSNNILDGDLGDLVDRLLNLKKDRELSKMVEKKSATIKVNDTLNVRSSPDDGIDNIVRKLKNGDVVVVIGEQEGWLQIGENEWISAAYAEVKTEEVLEYDEAAIESLADLVYQAVSTWFGTDEMGLINALAQLENKSDVIVKFKETYLKKYKEDIVERIESELNDGLTDIKYYVTAMQLLGVKIQAPSQPGQGKKLHNENIYVVKDGKAYIRDEKGNVLPDKKIISKWTTVTLLETKSVKPEGSDKEIVNAKLSYKEGDQELINWTNMTNLYAQFWDPEAHKEEYEKVDKGYAEAMLAVDTEKTRAARIKSGAGVMAVVDKFYPNSKKISDLSSEFQPKLNSFIDFIGEHDISVNIAATLRHPLRSLVFDSAISAAINEEGLMKAQAQSIRYSLPIDWLHYKDDGTLDVGKSRSQADIVKGEFGIGSTAARGVKDELGGTFSNHNFGNAVDMQMNFGFTEKTIEKDDKEYEINAANETPTKIDKKWVLNNCGNKPLAKLGKEGFGVTRVLDNDAIHWSPTGK